MVKTYKITRRQSRRSDEPTQTLGDTKVSAKRVGPDWTPTSSYDRTRSDLKYMPPGPDNPLGPTRLPQLPAYLIHGTYDTRKIGGQSSDG